MNTFIFEKKTAEAVGVDCAVMLHNLEFWIEKNRVNGKHLHEGKTWTYNSVLAFREIFPFWTAQQIRRILKKLIDGGYLETGNFNRSAYDRTTWYTLTKKYFSLSLSNNSISGKSQLENGKNENEFDQTSEPIPDIIPDTYTDAIPDIPAAEPPEAKHQKIKPEHIELSKMLMVSIEQKHPGTIAKKKADDTMMKWADIIRLTIEQDGRTPDEIINAINATAADAFWSGVILSAANLRKHFPRLAILSQKNSKAAGVDFSKLTFIRKQGA